MTRGQGRIWTCLTMCLAAAPALALSWDLPAGRFERRAKPGELREVEVLPDRALRLVFAPGGEHALAVLEARYRMTIQKFSDFGVSATVRSLSLGKRRVGRLERMGVVLTEGKKLELTLSYACTGGHEAVQFCLHEDLDGRPHVVCHELSDPSSHCTPPPPGWPGQPINPPVNAAAVNEDEEPDN